VLDHLVAVEAEMLGIAAEKAQGIGTPGCQGEVALLERIKIGRLDPQPGRDIVQVLATRLARLAEDVAQLQKRVPGGIRDIGSMA